MFWVLLFLKTKHTIEQKQNRKNDLMYKFIFFIVIMIE
jgi:hypothetical protein